MSYFMSNGQAVRQAAAGVSVRASGGLARVPMRGLGQAAETPQPVSPAGGRSEYDCMTEYYQKIGSPSSEYAGLSPEEREAAGFSDYIACREAAFAAGPGVGSGQPNPYGIATRPYRDGVFTRGATQRAYGTELHSWNDGIFGGRLMGLGQAPAAALDLKSGRVLREWKHMMRSIASSYSADDMDVPYWTPAAEMAWNQIATGMSASFSQPVASYVEVVRGRNVPSAAGATAAIRFAVMSFNPDPAVSDAYAKQHWPHLVAWTLAPVPEQSKTVVSPPLTEAEASAAGTKKAGMGLWIGLGAAAALGIGYLLTRKRRG